MKFSYQWLSRWVRLDIDAATLAERLTTSGLEVDSVAPVAAAFSGVVVARIEECRAHPGADKLSICTVDDGSGMGCSITRSPFTVRVNGPPTAQVRADDFACVGDPVLFDGSDSSDPQGQKLKYFWDFGDGSTGEGAKVKHAYASGGTYPVQTSPGFFQVIHPWLPMTYVVGGLRHTINGGPAGPVVTAALVLLAFGLGALALTVGAARRSRRLTPAKLHPELTM